jgi:hypothetical protein
LLPAKCPKSSRRAFHDVNPAQLQIVGIEKAVKQALRRAFLDGEREPIRTSHAERLDQARRSLRGLEKPTIRRDRGSSSTTSTPELGVRLFDLN